MAIVIHSSSGQIFCDTRGNIIHTSNFDFNGFSKNGIITKFDFLEYLQHHKTNFLPSNIDILDIGHWHINGNYEPPCKEYRHDIKMIDLEETEKEIATKWWNENIKREDFCKSVQYIEKPISIVDILNVFRLRVIDNFIKDQKLSNNMKFKIYYENSKNDL